MNAKYLYLCIIILTILIIIGIIFILSMIDFDKINYLLEMIGID